MYPYNPYYYYNNSLYRYPANFPYDQSNQVNYQHMYNNQGNNWGYNPYAQTMYGFQNPYVNSYDYTGYTETGNVDANANASLNVGDMSKGVMSYFQKEDGQFDFDKMMSTTGQVMKTVKDVSPIVKGIGTFVKGIK